MSRVYFLQLMKFVFKNKNYSSTDLFLNHIKAIFIKTIGYEFELLGNKELVHQR
jgi:hypothetical protein